MKKRPCDCNNAIAGIPWDRSQCHRCWSALNNPRYRVLWGLEEGTLEQAVRRPKANGASCCGGGMDVVVFVEEQTDGVLAGSELLI